MITLQPNFFFCHQELSKAQRDLARVKKELTELAETLERLNAELKVIHSIFVFLQFSRFLLSINYNSCTLCLFKIELSSF
jgi:hypothetical protein